MLTEARERMTDAFKAVAGDTLSTNAKQFLEMARQTLDTVLADAKGDIGKRQEAIDGMVRPLSDSLREVRQYVKDLEGKREAAYSSLESQLKLLVDSEKQLQKETNNLVTALRTPQVRGRWGEMTLRRVVELAGMVEYCDFNEQVSVTTESGRLRPDMIVRLPSNREIVRPSSASRL